MMSLLKDSLVEGSLYVTVLTKSIVLFYFYFIYIYFFFAKKTVKKFLHCESLSQFFHQNNGSAVGYNTIEILICCCCVVALCPQ